MQLNSSSEKALYTAFDQSNFKSLRLAAWIGIALNLLFGLSDLFIFPDFFAPFFLLRSLVSGTSLLLFFPLFKRWVTIYFILLWIVCGISIQNAIMWNLMDLQHFQQHTLAYVVLFIGMGMLALWRWYFSVIVFSVTLFANAIAYNLWSPLSLSQWFASGGLLIFTALLFAVFQIRNRHKLILNELRVRIALADSNQQIKEQHEALQYKNQEITDSIHYAKYIQDALLPQRIHLEEKFNASFIYFRPKDIVSGDFYWFHSTQKFDFVVVADCTGHGVPGGFMTMLGLSFLDEIIKNQGIYEPALILDNLRQRIVTALNQKDADSQSKDGMDISILRFTKAHDTLVYSTANQSIYLVKNNEIQRLRGNNQPCGYAPHATPFVQFEVSLEPKNRIIAMSDGFADQFGGEKGKKIRSKNVQSLLQEWSNLPISEHENKLHHFFETWKGNLSQVDDVLVLGVEC